MPPNHSTHANRRKSSARIDFWATLEEAWDLVGDDGARFTLIHADAHDIMLAAAREVASHFPLVMATLEHILDSYSSPQLTAWSQQCKAAIADLLHPDLDILLGGHDTFGGILVAGWMASAGSLVCREFRRRPVAYSVLRELMRLESHDLLDLAWGMHRRKFGLRSFQERCEARREDIRAASQRDRLNLPEEPAPVPGSFEKPEDVPPSKARRWFYIIAAPLGLRHED